MTPTFTPGPWRWELNLKSRQAQLCGGVPEFDLTVMDFVRWGMGNKPGKLRAMLLDRCETMGEVVPGREHHSNWFQTINHPDARLIAASPDLHAACAGALVVIDTIPLPDGLSDGLIAAIARRRQALIGALAKVEAR